MAEKTQTGQGYLLIGTYTKQGGSKGVHVYDCDYSGGTFTYKGEAEVTNPSYIALDKEETHLYTVTEEGRAPSYVNSLDLDPATGEITVTGRSETDQTGLCNIIVSPDGGYLLTANYNSGSVSVFEIGDDGKTGPEIQKIAYHGSGPVASRQEASHVHCVRYCPCGKYIFVTDLGNDSLYRYNVAPGSEKYIDESTLKVFRMRPGSGPRHFVFDDEGGFMYLANELSTSVTVFAYEKGEISEIQYISASRTGNGDGADIKISPDGRYVYMSIRENGDDGIAIYSRNSETGILTSVGYQPCVEHPRNIEFSPGGRFLLVTGMKANKVQVFECGEDGSLSDTGRAIGIDSPTCLVFTTPR